MIQRVDVMANIIGLITDFGASDPYVGGMKAVMLSRNPRAHIVDLTHDIPPQNIGAAAGLLADSHKFFPKKSVFLVVVDPGVGTRRQILAVRTPDYYFVGPDNGVLARIICPGADTEIRVVQNPKFFLSHPPSNTFHGRDIMAPAAALLSTSHARTVFKQLGPRVRDFTRLEVKKNIRRKGELIGEIMGFDRFGNAITTIADTDLSVRQWHRSVIHVRGREIGRLAKTYADSKTRPVGIINSSHKLEIAKPNGSAQKALGLKPGQRVRVVYG